MEHTIESHNAALRDLCRICAGLCVTVKQKKNYMGPSLCASVSDDLFLLCGFDTGKDIEGTHSTFVCVKCKNAIRHCKDRKSETALNKLKHFLNDENIWCA